MNEDSRYEDHSLKPSCGGNGEGIRQNVLYSQSVVTSDTLENKVFTINCSAHVSVFHARNVFFF